MARVNNFRMQSCLGELEKFIVLFSSTGPQIRNRVPPLCAWLKKRDTTLSPKCIASLTSEREEKSSSAALLHVPSPTTHDATVIQHPALWLLVISSLGNQDKDVLFHSVLLRIANVAFYFWTSKIALLTLRMWGLSSDVGKSRFLQKDFVIHQCRRGLCSLP